MEYALEKLSDVQEEIQPLLEAHWKEIACNKDKIKMNPDWDQYALVEEQGHLGIYTARLEGALVGYFVVIATTHMHYKDHIFAVNDVIFLAKEHRKGSLGKRLIEYAQEDLRDKGVSVLAINTKVHQPFDGLMEHMGFSLQERLYSKCLIEDGE